MRRQNMAEICCTETLAHALDTTSVSVHPCRFRDPRIHLYFYKYTPLLPHTAVFTTCPPTSDVQVLSSTCSTTMASYKDHSSQASMPSSTSLPLYNIPISSVFSAAAGSATWLYTTLAIVASLLILEQSVYRYKKRHLPGASWTIPVIGKFADSMKPTMEGYMKQWKSGALSAISVFNM